jgi:hypothetical protein
VNTRRIRSARGSTNKETPPVVASTTVFDSLLFRDAFATERMRAVFSDLAPAMVDRVLEARSALSP